MSAPHDREPDLFSIARDAGDETDPSALRSARKGAIFTVPAGRPFLAALAEAILSGNLPRSGGMAPDPLALSRMTILLPTRRAARALQDAFLDASKQRGGARALLLPSIRPIAENDEDRGLIESFGVDHATPTDGLDVPEAIGKLERRLVLTRLVMAWSQAMRKGDAASDDLVASAGAGTPAQAARLAAELATLMDAVETENVSIGNLAGLVPDHFSEHWQRTLDFLKIVVEFWPAHLAEHALLSPMDRRNRIILAEARRLAHKAPDDPLIIAGVTGSIPATAELMRAALSHETSAIVLPALDTDLDEPSWQSLAGHHHEHPQFGFRALLDRLGIARADVSELVGVPFAAPLRSRAQLISQALRPSGSMAAWRDYAQTANLDDVRAALANVSLIEAGTEQDEAETVALILREALETPGRTAALVSPDRLLARRVAVRLESWGIRVDDSAGRPFAKTVPGAFLDLIVEAWSSRFAPPQLMALLKHPLTRLGLAPGDVRRAARILELAAFRTPYLETGLGGLEAALDRAKQEAVAGERRHRTVRRLSDDDWQRARDLVTRLQTAFVPFDRLSPHEALSLADLAAAHAAVGEAIAVPPVEAATPVEEQSPEPDACATIASPLWDGEAGEAAQVLFANLEDMRAVAPDLKPADYPDFYRALVAGETVRVRIPVHPRLSIWGPFEARLQQPDVIVLGSLNEGTWPKAADPGAWLNRPMRQTLGLPSPEEETGRAAHDLTTFLGAETVILTRANKVDGVPQVASRWLLRLNALLDGGLGLKDVLKPTTPWLAWARSRDHIERHQPARIPTPRPPLDLRPRRASVSEVETWISNPYAIFARRILGLEPLPPLGAEPGPQQKGQIVHDALSRFTKQHPDRLPADVLVAFRACALDAVRVFGQHPRVRAFWLPRLERFAQWFAETEPARRRGVTALLAEVPAQLSIAAAHAPFLLTARADRLDVTPSGLLITDYKTGMPPTDTAVREGNALQLPLEAAMAIAGAFPDITGPVAGLRYISATGSEPPGREQIVNLKDVTAADLAAQALAGLTELIALFDDPNIPYKALRRPRFTYIYDDYAHLARVAEWAGGEGDGEGGE